MQEKDDASQEATAVSAHKISTAQTAFLLQKRADKTKSMQTHCRVTCADPVNQQGALPLRSGYKVEHAGLLHKVTVK